MNFHPFRAGTTLTRSLCQRFTFGSNLSNLLKVNKEAFTLQRQQYAADSMKGRITVKQPIKLGCTAGKTYNWCACGLSSKQPLCDGSHKESPQGLTPFRFTVSETKEYLFCQCKHTNKRPFCDGTHKSL